MAEQKYKIGMVGLGVMGRNLVLNVADHGFAVSGYDKDLSKVGELRACGCQRRFPYSLGISLPT